MIKHAHSGKQLVRTDRDGGAERLHPAGPLPLLLLRLRRHGPCSAHTEAREAPISALRLCTGLRTSATQP